MILPEQYENAKQYLLLAFNTVAPSAIEQAALVVIVKEMKDEKEEPVRILIGIAALIVDGLRYGNWPGKAARG